MKQTSAIPEQSPEHPGTTLVFDIEANGLLDEVTQLHCIVIQDLHDGALYDYGPDAIQDGLSHLGQAQVLIGHNIVGYDIPAIRKLHKDWQWDGLKFDTAVASRMVWADIKQQDFKLHKKGKIPGKLIGKHSLESWGYRLGDYKGDFSGPWDQWTPEMHEYCKQDVRLNTRLLKKILDKPLSARAVEIDHRVQEYLEQQKVWGFPLNREKAIDLYAELAGERDRIHREMLEMVPSWYVSAGEFTPKRDNRTQGYVQGATLTKVKLVDFNPGSDSHVASRLKELYGWTPDTFTDTGQPKVDEAVLGELEYPLAQKLCRWKMLDKRIQQIAEGKQAWLKNLHEDGKIHHSCLASGTVTGRGAHMDPNLGQVPSSKKPFGEQCRSLFTVDEHDRKNGRFEMVGSDLEGIELRCLGHYMARYDKGAFLHAVVQGSKDDATDIHSVNQRAAGLPTRDDAKTFIS